MTTTRHLPPGPKGYFVLGNLLELNSDPLGFFSRCAREYGDVVRFHFGPFPAYLLNHPKLAEELLVTQYSKFIKSSVYRRGLRVLGKGLLTSEGDFWHRQRRMVQPAFHQERIASYGDVMVAYTNQLLDTWQDSDYRDIHQEMMQLTLAIVAKTLLGVDVVGETKEVHSALTEVMEFNNHFSNQYFLPSWLPTKSNRCYQRAIQQLDTIIYRLINQRHSDGKDTGDLLSLLLQVRDEGDGSTMTNHQLRDEMMTLMLAGHETTANTLTWTWFLLSEHPDVEEKLMKELNSVLSGRIPTVNDLQKLRYTERVVLESMRLYPSVWGISREILQECELGGYHLSAGSTVFLSQWVLQRDPRFFNSPEVFNPDRWADNLLKRLPTYAYFPFGGGQRICIGRAFAMMEVVLLLATIIQKFRLTRQPDQPVVLQPSLTLRPKYGMKMLLTKR